MEFNFSLRLTAARRESGLRFKLELAFAQRHNSRFEAKLMPYIQGQKRRQNQIAAYEIEPGKDWGLKDSNVCAEQDDRK